MQDFDRVIGTLTDLPDVRQNKPTTVTTMLPIVGAVTTYVVQMYKSQESGHVLFLQVVDAEGRERFVLPHKVVEAIARQRERLADRSTPESRARKRKAGERARRRKEREARRATFASRKSG
jgi:hypothetical protein